MASKVFQCGVGLHRLPRRNEDAFDTSWLGLGSKWSLLNCSSGSEQTLRL